MPKEQMQTGRPDASTWWKILVRLSSLKITVVLFSISLFLILVGTLAQATEGLWAVIDQYFRSFYVFIPLQAFVPPAWFPDPELQNYLDTSPLGIIFPGGKTLGALLMINLIAAHVVRFKANGSLTAIRLGSFFIVTGLVLTVLIILGASYKDGVQDQPLVSYITIWRTMLSALIAIAASMAATVFFLESSQTLERILLIIGVVLVGIAASALYVLGAMYEQMESAMRIVWQLTQASVVGAVLLTGCSMIFRNRGGIVLLHFGISLMMVNELFVGMYAVEERITVAEGETTSFAYNPHDVELAITYRGEAEDRVVSLPLQELEKRGNLISHELLPFDIRIEAYFPNSKLVEKENPFGVDEIPVFSRGQYYSTRDALKLQPACGRGLHTRAVQIKRWAGAAAQQEIDMATAYVSIVGAEIENAETSTTEGSGVVANVLMLSQHFSERSSSYPDDGANAEKIKVDGKTYELAIRFRRVEKPYSIRLLDVKEESHHGSTSHKKFGSDFLITDRNSGEVQNGAITMNNPLRFRGETFYQSGYSQVNSPTGPVEVSTFQVVTNQSWMIPYIGCMYVVIGMLAQFGSGLLKFSERIQKRRKESRLQTGIKKQIEPLGMENAGKTGALEYAVSSELEGNRSLICWLLPLVMALLATYTAYKLSFGSKIKSDEFNIREAGGIPISSGGRFQPIDSFARVKLRNSSDYESVSLTDSQVERELKGDRNRIYATEWLLDVITNPQMADEEYRIFRIYDPFLINKLGIEKKRKGYTYTYNEVSANINDFNSYVQQAINKKNKDRKSDGLSFQQRKALTLSGQIRAYEDLRNTALFLDPKDDKAIDKLLNGNLLYHPIMPEIKADDTGESLDAALVDRILAEENARSISFMSAILRFVRQRGSLVAGQANNPLFVPTCDSATVHVADKNERLALTVGDKSESNQINPGMLVKQRDDGTVWRLINDRGSTTAISKDTDWEIQPGMEVLLVSSARLVLREFCETNNISTQQELMEKLVRNDRDIINIVERKQSNAGNYLSQLEPEINAVYQKTKGKDATPAELAEIENKIGRILDFLQKQNLETIWQEYQQYANIFYNDKLEERTQGTEKFHEVLRAYKAGKVNEFNQSVAEYRKFFDELKLADYDIEKVKLELFYHYSAPLFQALIFYGIATLLVILTWIFYGVALENIGLGLQRSALVVLAIGSLIHTIGIVERVMITGKAPVTNLYASSVFISWGSVVCGFIIDLIVRYASPKASKLGIGALLGSIMGFVVIMVSFNLALRSDTFGKVEAVLDTQFWLATHVVCVTFGYVATFVAGALGLVYLGGSAFSPVFDKEVRRGVSWIIYGIVCFALLLSFFGTVLGGLWADDSWGRFWGWDPKENGALLIVIWNALILHARWGGMIRERGLAILALGGNVVTCWSWFGVNELGVGLHSYGFTDGLLATLGWIASAHLAVICLASLIPIRYWRGYQQDNLVSEPVSQSPKVRTNQSVAGKRRGKKNRKGNS